jgi:class 3 adenylate cyclase
LNKKASILEKLETIETLLNSGELSDENKKIVSDLADEYKKIIRRYNKIIRKSDRVSYELNIKKDKLESLSNRLSRYLSPQIYKMVFSEENTEVKSKRKKLTIFFSDIKDFTATTDILESEELTILLNDYLTQMSEIALSYGATIDKYIGDAIVIFFGDPESNGYKEDAKKCVEMALAMKERIAQIEKKYVDEGIINSFKVRMGINTGYVTVGNFGSEKRMDYTIIGGNVNLASRLESIAEPDSILISHETYSLVKEFVTVIPQEPVKVKGISKSILTYRLENLKEKMPEELQIIKDGLKNLDSKQEIIDKLELIIQELKH